MDHDKDESPDDDMPPGEAFKQGAKLIWQAARGVAGEIRNEIKQGEFTKNLRQAAEEMKARADAAIHGTPPPDEGQRIDMDEEQPGAAGDGEPKVDS